MNNVKRIRNSNNFDATGKDYQATATGAKTLTVPDQAMSIPEIISRYARGLSLDQGRIPLYENDDIDNYSFIDIRRLDYAERQELKEEIDQRVSDMRTKMEDQEKAASKKRRDRELDLEVENRIKQQKQQPTPPQPIQ